MRPINLILRCYAKREKDKTWYAICLDLNLIASGDSYKQARHKLHNMIADYINEALTEDVQYVDQLIPRRAPFYFFIRYYLAKIIHYLSSTSRFAKDQLYLEPIPLVVASTHGR